jgi:hypothetical protein
MPIDEKGGREVHDVCLPWGHKIILKMLADRGLDLAGRRQPIDIREIGEGMRQVLIDLGMHEPPLVEIEADQIEITEAGRAFLEQPLPPLSRGGR